MPYPMIPEDPQECHDRLIGILREEGWNFWVQVVYLVDEHQKGVTLVRYWIVFPFEEATLFASARDALKHDFNRDDPYRNPSSPYYDEDFLRDRKDQHNTEGDR